MGAAGRLGRELLGWALLAGSVAAGLRLAQGAGLPLLAARRVGGTTPGNVRAAVGAVAPDFSLSDCRGRRHRLSDYRGRKVLLCFFCGCPVCRAMAGDWRRRLSVPEKAQFVIVTPLGLAGAGVLVRAAGPRCAVLLDRFGQVAGRYTSLTCPRCWLIDEAGRVLYVTESTGRSRRADEEAIIQRL